MKKKFTQELVLAVPDLDKKNEDEGEHFRLCNGGMLSMEGEDEK